jgi:hypothetical protein
MNYRQPPKQLNIHKLVITGFGVLCCTGAVVFHVVEQGGPYQPIGYAYNFPWEVAMPLVLGVLAILSAKGLNTYK